MTTAEQYRTLAAELRVKARLVEDRAQAADLITLAASYVRLAEAAEKNSTTDIVAEFGPPPRIKEQQ
jgi:hypothetical protein